MKQSNPSIAHVFLGELLTIKPSYQHFSESKAMLLRDSYSTSCRWVIALLIGCLLLPSGCAPGVANSMSSSNTAKQANESVPKVDINPAQPAVDARLKATIEGAEGVLHLYQDSPLQLQASPWVRMHAMVQYPLEAAKESPQFAAQREALIKGVISSPIPDVGVLTVRDDRPVPRTEGYLFGRQHHPDQVLNYLSVAGVELSESFIVEGRQFTVRDLLDSSMLNARTDQELSWTVAAYAHYLEPGQQWSNRFAEPMTLATLLKKLLATNEDACGGTHRLAALARVIRRPSLNKGSEMSEVWADTLKALRVELERLKASQQPDGFFELPPILQPREGVSLVERNIQFTGHSIEWFALLPEPELARSEWVVRAVEALITHMPELHDRYASAVAPTLAWSVIEPRLQFSTGAASHAVGGLTRWILRVREQP